MDWIDTLNEQTARAELAQDHRMREALQFEAIAERVFQALVARLKRDIDRLNKNPLIRQRGGIRVNGRSVEPDDDRTLFIDILAFPVILLDVRLVSPNIRLRQKRMGSPEDSGSVVDEWLSLERGTATNPILIKDYKGDLLLPVPDGACEYILRRFAPLCP